VSRQRHTISDGDRFALGKGTGTGTLHLGLALTVPLRLSYMRFADALVTSASDSPMRKLNSVLLSSTYPLTDKNGVQACCHNQDSLMVALRRPSA